MAFPTNPSPGDSYTDEYGTVWVYAGTVNGWYRQEVSTPNDTSYTAAISGPAGSNTQVQFNDNGELAGDSGLTYNKTTDALSSGAFIPTGSTVPTNGLYRPSANQVAISTNGTGRLFVDASGRIGVGTTSPSELLDISPTTELGAILLGRIPYTTYGSFLVGSGTLANHVTKAGNSTVNVPSCKIDFGNGPIIFSTAPGAAAGVSRTYTETARIDSSGRLLVGTSTSAASKQLIFQNSSEDALTIRVQSSSYPYNWINLDRQLAGGNAVSSGASIGIISFRGWDGSNAIPGASIGANVDGTPGANDMPGRLVFSVTADGASSPTERMRIKSTGIVNVGNTPVYADNAAAKTGGLVDGDIYRKSDGTLMIVYT